MITTKLLTPKTKRRPGLLISKVLFIVAHDTGNPGTSAAGNVKWYESTNNEASVSAHIFVDDKEVIECIPAFKLPEKAWHVLYERTIDNKLFGADANNAAIGVELCYGGKIDNKKAYENYVLILAGLCKTHKLDPLTKIVSHAELDPERKTDPINSLKLVGKDMTSLKQDVSKLVKF